MMAALRHPCCVQFLGFVASPPAIVSEWCARGSLADVLAAARRDREAAAALPWSRRLSIAIDAASGLVHLHARSPPVLHRDLKVRRAGCGWARCNWQGAGGHGAAGALAGSPPRARAQRALPSHPCMPAVAQHPH